MCVPAADPRWAKTFFQPTELAFAGLEFICLSIVCLLIALTARRNRGPPMQMGDMPKEVKNKEKVQSPRHCYASRHCNHLAGLHTTRAHSRCSLLIATWLQVGPLDPRHTPAPGED
jgi:hypothetical protein